MLVTADKCLLFLHASSHARWSMKAIWLFTPDNIVVINIVVICLASRQMVDDDNLAFNQDNVSCIPMASVGPKIFMFSSLCVCKVSCTTKESSSRPPSAWKYTRQPLNRHFPPLKFSIQKLLLDSNPTKSLGCQFRSWWRRNFLHSLQSIS